MIAIDAVRRSQSRDRTPTRRLTLPPVHCSRKSSQVQAKPSPSQVKSKRSEVQAKSSPKPSRPHLAVGGGFPLAASAGPRTVLYVRMYTYHAGVYTYPAGERVDHTGVDTYHAGVYLPSRL